MMHCNQIVCLVEWVSGVVETKEALYVAIRQVRMQEVAATVPRVQDQTIDLRFRIPPEGSTITHMTTDVRYAPARNDVCRQSAGRGVHTFKWA